MKKLLLSLGALSAVVAPVAAVVACGSHHKDSKLDTRKDQSLVTDTATDTRKDQLLVTDTATDTRKDQLLVTDTATDTRKDQSLVTDTATDTRKDQSLVTDTAIKIFNAEQSKITTPAGTDTTGNGGVATDETHTKTVELTNLLDELGYEVTDTSDLVELLGRMELGAQSAELSIPKVAQGTTSSVPSNGIHSDDDFMLPVKSSKPMTIPASIAGKLSDVNGILTYTDGSITKDLGALLDTKDATIVKNWGTLDDDFFDGATSILYLHNGGKGTPETSVTVVSTVEFGGKLYELTNEALVGDSDFGSNAPVKAHATYSATKA